ncbi:MAG: 4-hydroxy-tetrahydrodipicolinate synthase [Fibrobacterota bacterium]
MKLQGCFVAVVTPLDTNQQLDEAGLRRNVDFLIDNGVSGIVPCGTTGESATLSWEEHNKVVDIVIDQVKGRVTVVAGAGSNNTAESIEAARHAKEAGADAILCITPYYNKPTQEGLYQHYRAITTNVDIPIVVYNVPGRTGVNLQPETMERLCEFDNVVAVKEASGNVTQVSEIHRRCGERISILSGDDALTLPILCVGGSGVISVVGNFIPDRMSAMVSAFLDGDTQKAREIHEGILPIAQAMFIETNPIPVKTAMNHLGLSAGSFRLPMVAMTEDNKQKLISVLNSGNVKPLK